MNIEELSLNELGLALEGIAAELARRTAGDILPGASHLVHMAGNIRRDAELLHGT